MKSEYQTFKKYLNKNLTASMEDYIEMIYRLSISNGYTRIQELADNLNVSPPSTSVMIQKLAKVGYLKYQKYGVVVLEEKGKRMGHRLLERHTIVSQLLLTIGIDSKNVLVETEKIEHTLSSQSIKCIKNYLKNIKQKD